MTSRPIALIAMLTAVSVSSAAEPKGAPTFEALDVDKDGVITVIESRADRSVAARFSTADKDQDGYLSRAEFDAMPKS